MREFSTATHWGAYRVQAEGGELRGIRPVPEDPEPSDLGQSLLESVTAQCRVERPMVREGYLAKGAASREGRGREAFVPVSWERALSLVAEALQRTREDHGNEAIYGGSYGWASAGRFHHAQSQIHRFLNHFGGYTASVGTYSFAAAEVLLPHLVGPYAQLRAEHTPWETVAKHGQLVVCFGGLPEKNTQVDPGGVVRHTAGQGLRECRRAGVRFVSVSPIRDDSPDYLEAEWLSPRPNTDTAVLLGLAHTLYSEGLHDPAFLERYCAGFDRFLPYLLGQSDGQKKDADWASGISGLPAEAIRSLARAMAAHRTLVSVNWSLQRGDHGEQPYWMALTLAAMIGQIGLPGGGFGFGYSSINGVGRPPPRLRWPVLQQGENPVKSVIPVARVADMLLHPGHTIPFNGGQVTFADIRLVYWAGGNPFHHHQDLNRLKKAFRRPETVVVHEPWWTATARHADIVLPATTSLERNDLFGPPFDNTLIAMHQAIAPVGAARNDYSILAGLAARLGFAESFTEGRDEMQWIRAMYEDLSERATSQGMSLPDFEKFWADGSLELPSRPPNQFLSRFRSDPEAHRLSTPSGKLEIFSAVIDGFGYDDCPGHPVWLEPYEWLGSEKAQRYPLHLVSNQPKTRLHSQMDQGRLSQQCKIQGREPVRISAVDASARGISSGDVVRLFNDRGACLAGAVVTDAVSAGVIQMATGAWFDPGTDGESDAMDRHGNPNILTRDKGCSSLSQGPSPLSTLVEIERWTGEVPDVEVFNPPRTVRAK